MRGVLRLAAARAEVINEEQRRNRQHEPAHQAREAEEGHHDRGNQNGGGLPAQLLGQVAAEIAFRGGARDDDTGRRRNQQRRNLRDDAFADGEQREVLQRLQQREPFLRHADDESADDVDATMISAAMASPRTNLLAPSIAP